MDVKKNLAQYSGHPVHVDCQSDMVHFSVNAQVHKHYIIKYFSRLWAIFGST